MQIPLERESFFRIIKLHICMGNQAEAQVAIKEVCHCQLPFSLTHQAQALAANVGFTSRDAVKAVVSAFSATKSVDSIVPVCCKRKKINIVMICLNAIAVHAPGWPAGPLMPSVSCNITGILGEQGGT